MVNLGLEERGGPAVLPAAETPCPEGRSPRGSEIFFAGGIGLIPALEKKSAPQLLTPGLWHLWSNGTMSAWRADGQGWSEQAWTSLALSDRGLPWTGANCPTLTNGLTE